MKKTRFIALLPALLLASCAADSDKKQSTAQAEPTQKSMDEWVSEKTGSRGSRVDWKSQNKKRSSFESQGEATAFKKNYKKQEYKTGDYAKKSWWGNKDYDKKSYSGETDGSRFQQTSSLSGKTARETTSTSAKIPDDYQTSGFSTNAARETDSKDFQTSANEAIEKRRKSYQRPEIIDWREQRALSLDQSKSLLGR